MKKLVRENLNESPWMFNPKSGEKKYISKEELDDMIKSGKAKPISLKEAFPGPIKKPYIGLVIKINNGDWGCIVDVFERHSEYLFDLFKWDERTDKWEVEKNLRWSKDYKTAFGDWVNGWSAFGDNGEPNKRHEEEIMPILNKVVDVLGINLQVAKDENLN